MSKITKGSLGDRMKKYESVSRNTLMRRTPVIIRIDGKAFHTFCRGFAKPFDNMMIDTMQEAMKYLCENIQGCVLGFTQSDEITLVLTDYKELNTEPWFGNNVQKMVSVSASMFTLAFNTAFVNNLALVDNHSDWKLLSGLGTLQEDHSVYVRKTLTALCDSRAFNLPKEEVCNMLIWRQQDCERNSILSSALSMFSQKQIHGINTKKLQDKMFTEKDFNWNDLPTTLKRGSCCIKNPDGVWFIDNNIPRFSQDREYVERLL